MRTIRAASAALLTVAAISLTAPVASAATEGGNITPFGFSVTPSTIAAGGRVTLSVSDCDHTAYASSAVFDRTRIPRGGTAHATVDRDARRGATYRVTFTCDGRSGTTSLTIAGAGPAPTPTPIVPSGVRGGLGGSIGSGTPEIAAGAALVLIAASGTVYAARRRTASRGH